MKFGVILLSLPTPLSFSSVPSPGCKCFVRPPLSASGLCRILLRDQFSPVYPPGEIGTLPGQCTHPYVVGARMAE